MPAPPIPPSLLLEATVLVKLSLHDILNHFKRVAPDAVRDRTVLFELRAALLTAIDTAIQDVIHDLESRMFMRKGLPAEIWPAIWSQLSMHDRVAVTHVCRDWRHIALASATLWSNIEFEYCCNTPEDAYERLAAEERLQRCRMEGSLHSDHCKCTTNGTHFASLTTILERGLAPIHLTLSAGGYHSSCTSKFLANFAEALKPYAHRLVKLEIIGSAHQLIHLPLFVMRAGMVFPRLVSLCVTGYRRNTENSNSDPFLAANPQLPEFQAPMLRTAKLVVYSPWLERILLNGQISAIHTLVFGPRNFQAVIGVLRTCPRLRTLRLECRAYTTSSSVIPESLTHGIEHALEELSVAELPVDGSNHDEKFRLLAVLLRPSQQAIELSLSISSHTQLALRSLQRFTTMFADISREQGSAAGATFRVATATNFMWRRPALEVQFFVDSLRRSLIVDWGRAGKMDLTPVWTALAATRICNLQLMLTAKTPYYPPFPLLKSVPGGAESPFVLPRLELFTIIKTKEASLDQLRAIN